MTGHSSPHAQDLATQDGDIPHDVVVPLIERFLQHARSATQWHANREVLAPGETTPYLEGVMMAAMAVLAFNIPGATLQWAQAGSHASPPPASKPVMKKNEWLLELDGQWFGMEGPTDMQAVRQRLHADLAASGANLAGIVYAVAPQDPENLWPRFPVDSPAAKSLDVMRRIWAAECAAQLLQYATQSAPSRARKARL